MFTRKQHKRIADFLYWLKNELNLNEWTLHLIWEPIEPDETAMAKVEPTEGRNVATIQFAGNANHETPDSLAQILTHELVHLHHRNASEPVRKLCDSGAVSHSTYMVLWEHHRLHCEIMTDQISHAFWRLLRNSQEGQRLLKRIYE